MKVRRYLSATSTEILNYSTKETLEAIKASEGRTILCECIASNDSIVNNEITNAEIAVGFGADMIVLNLFDVDDPKVNGLNLPTGNNVIHDLKRLTGVKIGLNLEPIDAKAVLLGKQIDVPKGRQLTSENLEKAIELGFDIVVITGNPETGVSNDSIATAIALTKQVVSDKMIIIAGKMHGAGMPVQNIMNSETIQVFSEKGADIILFPLPGTVPGVNLEIATQWVRMIHEKGCLALAAIGTSQEASSTSVIENLGLNFKMIGADIVHLGDSATMCPPENIYTLSMSIRGKRHTVLKISKSLNR